MDGAGGRREYLNGFRGKLDQASLIKEIRYIMGIGLSHYKKDKTALVPREDGEREI